MEKSRIFRAAADAHDRAVALHEAWILDHVPHDQLVDYANSDYGDIGYHRSFCRAALGGSFDQNAWVDACARVAERYYRAESWEGRV